MLFLWVVGLHSSEPLCTYIFLKIRKHLNDGTKHIVQEAMRQLLTLDGEFKQNILLVNEAKEKQSQL